MVILRFDDVGNSSHPRKKSSRGLLVLGLVATLLGIGSAFASTTITINGGASTNIGQGVSYVSACDDNIKIGLTNSLIGSTDSATVDSDGKIKGRPRFSTASLVLSDINSNLFDTQTATGCGGEYLDLQIFRSIGSDNYQAYTCGQIGATGNLLDAAGVSSPGAVSCTESRTISIHIPVSNTNSSWTIPITPAPGLSPLDISYFTIVSRSA